MHRLADRARACCRSQSRGRRAAAAAPTDIPAAVEAVAKAQITARDARAPIRFLASDALEGRGPATRGDTLARLYLATELNRWAISPAARTAAGSRPSTWSASPRKLPAVWSISPARAAASISSSPTTTSPARGVQTPTAAIEDARAGVRRLRHRSARVQVGRLQGRGRQGQGAGHAQQRSGLGSEVVCRQYAPVLRPLDLQVRERRAPWRGRRRSSCTPRRRPDIPGRWCSPPGAASSSSCPPKASRASSSRAGPPKTPRAGW